jgi:hypothetical protein
MSEYRTVFGSLDHFEKGGIQVIGDDPKNYVFSNVFEVASRSAPYERVAVGRNIKYVIEAVRAEGKSPWFAADHDEFALVMDGEVTVQLVKPDTPLVPAGKEGAVRLEGEPKGRKMGTILARRGHMALLPKGAAYRFAAAKPAAMIIQSIAGDVTVEKWAEICLS